MSVAKHINKYKSFVVVMSIAKTSIKIAIILIKYINDIFDNNSLFVYEC